MSRALVKLSLGKKLDGANTTTYSDSPEVSIDAKPSIPTTSNIAVGDSFVGFGVGADMGLALNRA